MNPTIQTYMIEGSALLPEFQFGKQSLIYEGTILSHRIDNKPSDEILSSIPSPYFQDRYGLLAYAAHQTMNLQLVQSDMYTQNQLENFTTSSEIQHGFQVLTRLLGICAIQYRRKNDEINRTLSMSELYFGVNKSYRSLVVPFCSIDGYMNEDVEHYYGLRNTKFHDAVNRFHGSIEGKIEPKHWKEIKELEDYRESTHKHESGCLAFKTKISEKQASVLNVIWKKLLGHCMHIEWLYPYDLSQHE